MDIPTLNMSDNKTSLAVKHLGNFPISDDINPFAYDEAQDSLTAIAKKYQRMEKALEQMATLKISTDAALGSLGDVCNDRIKPVRDYAQAALDYDPLC